MINKTEVASDVVFDELDNSFGRKFIGGGIPIVGGGGGSGGVKPPLETILSSLTIEAFYVEDQEVPRLRTEYLNLSDLSGHFCNNAQFYVMINGIQVGTVNMNNEGGSELFPRNDDLNYPTAISKTGAWALTGVGSYAARYSRIDITEEQAQALLGIDNASILNITLVETTPNVHTDITWIRLSTRSSTGKLVKLYDQKFQLGQYYSFDLLNPQNGIILSV